MQRRFKAELVADVRLSQLTADGKDIVMLDSFFAELQLLFLLLHKLPSLCLLQASW